MLHASETLAMKADTLNRLRRNDRAMIRWICNVKANDKSKLRLPSHKALHLGHICVALHQ